MKEKLKNSSNKSVLMKGCEGCSIQVLQKLIKDGFDINTQDDYGDTPLIYGSIKGKINFVKFLIKQSANLDKQNTVGDTALIEACKNNHPKIVKLLIENGADLTVEDNKKFTATTIICQKNDKEYKDYMEIIEMLVKEENIAKINDQDKNIIFYGKCVQVISKQSKN